MTEEFLDGAASGSAISTIDRPSGRESTRILLIGKPEAVQRVIHDLYVCRFCDPGVWSKALETPAGRAAIARQAGEIVRIYKRYLTQ